MFEDTDALLRLCARDVNERLNGNVVPAANGFVLLAFPSNGALGRRVNYISNRNREDVVAAMKEIIARFEV